MPPHPISWYGLFYLLIPLAVGAYFLFRDILNRIQYVETLRIYWIVKDNGRSVSAYQPRIMRSFMRQDYPPYWRGRGVQFRVLKWTIQVGRLIDKADSLEDQIGRWMDDVNAKDIKKW